jgi:hypothetical protein
MELWGYFKICDSDGYSATENYIGYVTSGMEGYEGADGIGLGVNGAGVIKVTTVNTGLNFYPGDSYISLHGEGITIQAGVNTTDKYLNLYGKNIIFDNGRFEVYGVEPENQIGIYARFA